MIDHDLAVRPHHCTPPEILRVEYDGPEDDDWTPPRLIVEHPEGTRYHCDDCGLVWVSTWVPDHVGRTMVVCAHHEWQPETRRQRRRRLGVRWWQRERHAVANHPDYRPEWRP